jgi:pimeloyl-ACP methyl ester carboxylesterase
MAEVHDHTEDLDGQPQFWRSAEGPDPARAPVLYVHGVPTSSDLWLPFLERTGGLAPDLPGFGRSGKRGDGDFTMEGYDRFLERFLAHLGVERVRLVVQDWGGVGLLWAQRFPERVERLVIMDAVPFLPGYRWHRIARVWRARWAGEIAMGLTVKPVLRFISREANATPGPLPADLIDSAAGFLDQGTQRAILRLYRSSPPEKLAAAGANLGAITCPALVAWGDRDPYIPARFADAYAAALGSDPELLHLPDAGHWPWLDRPDLIERVAAFLDAAAP